MLSVTLDDPSVPAYVVDFVLYHELLHKKHGSNLVNGRRLAHSSGFRAEERQFAEYAAAEQRLKELALQQHGMGTLRLDGEND
jgi:predicted metal-dependent hydrolase